MGLMEAAPRDLLPSSMATKLVTCLRQKRIIDRSPDTRSWAGDLAKLIASVGSVRVELAISWYENNAGQPYTPRVVSARSFREKFDQIEQAMRRGGIDPLIEQPSEDAVNAARRLREKADWPPELLPHLARIVHAGRLKLARVIQILASYFGQSVLNQRETAFVSHLLDARFYASFVEDDWLAFWHCYVIKKSHWTGPAQSLYFNVATDTFHHSFWIDWAMHWAGDFEPFEPLYVRLAQDSN